MGKFVVKEVKSGFKFDLKAGNGEVIATSEVYTTEAACMNGIESVKKNAPVAEVEDQTVADYATVKNPKFEVYTDKAGNVSNELVITVKVVVDMFDLLPVYKDKANNYYLAEEIGGKYYVNDISAIYYAVANVNKEELTLDIYAYYKPKEFKLYFYYIPAATPTEGLSYNSYGSGSNLKTDNFIFSVIMILFILQNVLKGPYRALIVRYMNNFTNKASSPSFLSGENSPTW